MNRTLLVCVGISLLASAAFSRACGGQRHWGGSRGSQQPIIVVLPGANGAGTGGTGTAGTGTTGTGTVGMNGGTSNLEEEDELFLARRRRDTHDYQESKKVTHNAGAALGFGATGQSGSHDTKVKFEAGAVGGLKTVSQSHSDDSGTNEKKGIVGGAGVIAAVGKKKTTESKNGKHEENGGVFAAGGIVGGFGKHTTEEKGDIEAKGKEQNGGKIAGAAASGLEAASKLNADKSGRSTHKEVEVDGKAAVGISGAIAAKTGKKATEAKGSTKMENEGKTAEEAGGHLKGISEKQTTIEKGGKIEAEVKGEREAGITVGATAGLAGKRTAQVNENGSLTEKSKEIKVGIGYKGDANIQLSKHLVKEGKENAISSKSEGKLGVSGNVSGIKTLEINKQVKERGNIEDKKDVKGNAELKGGAGFSIIGVHKSKTDSVVKT